MKDMDDFRQYLVDQSETDMKERTVTNYIEQIASMDSKYGLDLEEVSEENIIAVLHNMDEALATSSMNYRRMILGHWLAFHNIEPGEDLQRVLDRKRVRNKRKLHPSDLLTKSEVVDIIEHTRSQTIRAFLAVLWDTGRRPSGVARLNVSDVTADKHGYVLTFRTTKTDQSRRPVRLLWPRAIAEFEKWWSMHPRKDDKKAPLFINQWDNRYNVKSLTTMLKGQHEERLGRGDGDKASLNLYLFRKSRATQLLKEGKLTEIQIKMRLGHKKHSNILEKYYTILDEEDQAEAELEYLGAEPEEDKAPEIIRCPNCGAPNESDASRCLRCKFPLSEEALLEDTRQSALEDPEMLEQITELVAGELLKRRGEDTD